MLRKRLIFTLLFSNNYFYLSRNFNLQKVGNLDWLKENYNFKNISAYIDELIVLDVSKNNKDIKNLSNNIGDICKDCFVPISIGGGIDNLDKVKILLKAGADKIVVNTAVFKNKKFIYQLSKYIGSQSIVISIDYKKGDNDYLFFISNGNEQVKLNSLTFFKYINEIPAGEIYLNSIDRDGTGQGLDFDILKKINKSFSKSIILCGGVGNKDHIYKGMKISKLDAIATSNLFNFIGDGFSNSRNYLINKKINLAIRESVYEKN